MELIKSSINFPLSFVDAAGNAGLNVGAEVYDVTTGTPVLLTGLTPVPLAASAFGSYSGTYAGVNGKTYLVIALAFQDVGLTIPDTTHAAAAFEVQVNSGAVTFLAFDYTSFDHGSGLDVRAKVYDLTTGAPVFVTNISMTHVAHGVYFATFTGTTGKPYQINSLPYSAGSPDTSRAAASQLFQCAASAYTALLASLVSEGTVYLVNGVSTTGALGSITNIMETLELELNPAQLIMELE